MRKLVLIVLPTLIQLSTATAGPGGSSSSSVSNQQAAKNQTAAARLNSAVNQALGKKKLSKAAEWRKGITIASQTGRHYEYHPDYEKMLKDEVKNTKTAVANWETGSSDFYIAEEGNQDQEVIKMTEGYQSGVVTHYKITGLAQDGIMRGALAAPVSAHTGESDAKKWSKEDKIKVSIAYKDQNGKNVEKVLHEATSLDLLTIMELEVPLVANTKVTLLVERIGANGWGANPRMYPESRTIEFTWDGSN